uniref:Uncharacterized protein n=1 Tax=Arundo donax TaxID=35708 RepID=A0A0A9H082_ARUDO
MKKTILLPSPVRCIYRYP